MGDGKDALHRLVRRQLARHGVAPSPELGAFIADVSRAYDETDRDRQLLERSLDLSSNELLEANRDLRSIIQASPDIYFWLHDDGTIRSVRARPTDDLWSARATLFGKRIQDVPVKRVAQRFEHALQSLRASGTSVTFEYALEIGGQVRDYEARMLPLTEGGSLAIIRNIASKRLAEVEQFRMLAEGVDDIMYLLDVRTRTILYVNDAFEAIYGVSRENIYEHPERLLQYIHDDDRERVAPKLVMHGDHEEEYRIVRPDGRVRWVLDRGYAVRDGTGDIYRIKGLSRDITDLKEREASIEAENLSLAEQVREGQEKLRQMQKMEALGRLAGGISHDFNNLLVVILSYAEFAREAASEGVRDDIEKIMRAAQRGADLTKQLLAFSRRQMLAPQVVRLNDVLTRSRSLVARLVTERVRLDYELDHRLPPIFVDGGQVEQIVMNLVVNARDAVGEDGRILVRTRMVTAEDRSRIADTSLPPEATVVLEVSDTGEGIPPEIRDTIFEPFFTTKPEGRGTGLGLATVFGIVSQSRGHIHVESEPGATTFSVYFPVHQALDSDAPPREERRSGPVTDAHILVVEDDPIVRAVAVRVLERSGYTVTRARNGRHALSLLDDDIEHVDMVLTDMVMPEMGGRQLADEILQRDPDMKLLFMSGYTEDEMYRSGMALRTEQMLDKPFTPDVLRRRVEQVLSGG